MNKLLKYLNERILYEPDACKKVRFNLYQQMVAV